LIWINARAAHVRQRARLSTDQKATPMSVTHPTTGFVSTTHQEVPPDRQQLMPAVIGIGIAVVTAVISLLMTGLPH